MRKKLPVWVKMIVPALILLKAPLAYAQEKVIFDTDIGPDWDDVGAIATLHALADLGEAEILAMMVSSGGHSATWGPPCLDAFNTFYSRPDIPIGVAEDGPEFGSSYNQQIAEEFLQDLGTGNAWDATELYRKILSEQPDSSVVIITVGFITNIEDLLKSEPDQYSELNGLALVNKKVKQWTSMGGGYPSSGGEFNFNRHASATVYAVENWPKPILFSGFEIGYSIHTGASLALTPESNPIRRAYELAGGYVGSTRSSWDQTAVLAAIRDPLLYWHLEETGYCHVFENGSNEWRASPDKDHSYLISEVSDAELVEIIDNLMADITGIPLVNLTSPVPESEFTQGADITMEAVASDSNGQVEKVEFYARTNKIGEDTTPPYTFVWTNPDQGGYYLRACVTDNDGYSACSETVKIYVGDVDKDFVGHWRFEDNASDSSQHGNDGTISGNPEYVNGKIGKKALEFKTDQDYVTITESPDFSTTHFTLTAWVKFPGSISEGWRTIVEHNRWGNNWYGLWKSANGNTFHFRWANAGNATSDFSSTIAADRWYHVAGTYDGETNTARLYLDGVLDKVIRNTASVRSEKADLRIGINLEGNEELNGIVDDIRIYKRVLDAGEISAISAPTHIEDDKVIPPEAFEIGNYPNPFNPSTIINYSIPVKTHVSIRVYDITGHLVKTLINEEKQDGSHTIPFHAKGLSSGVYYYHMRAGTQQVSNKMIVIK